MTLFGFCQVFKQKIHSELLLEILLSRGDGWDSITQFNPTTCP